MACNAQRRLAGEELDLSRRSRRPLRSVREVGPDDEPRILSAVIMQGGSVGIGEYNRLETGWLVCANWEAGQA
jgi:hypothetical protein